MIFQMFPASGIFSTEQIVDIVEYNDKRLKKSKDKRKSLAVF